MRFGFLHRTDCHDPPPMLRLHRRNRLPDQAQRRPPVAVDLRVELGRGDLIPPVAELHRRVQHQHINMPGAVDQPVRAVCGAEVGGAHAALPPHRRNFPLHGAHFFAVPAAMQHDIRPGFCQRDGNRPADAAAAAGDDGCFFRKIHRDAPLRVSVSCSSSAAVSTAYTGSSGTVFFTKPLRALPGPISTSASSPMAAMRRRESSM